MIDMTELRGNCPRVSHVSHIQSFDDYKLTYYHTASPKTRGRTFYVEIQNYFRQSVFFTIVPTWTEGLQPSLPKQHGKVVVAL